MPGRRCPDIYLEVADYARLLHTGLIRPFSMDELDRQSAEWVDRLEEFEDMRRQAVAAKAEVRRRR